jgi:hypothetical protein
MYDSIVEGDVSDITKLITTVSVNDIDVPIDVQSEYADFKESLQKIKHDRMDDYNNLEQKPY